jgi:hypothetical protein
MRYQRRKTTYGQISEKDSIGSLHCSARGDLTSVECGFVTAASTSHEDVQLAVLLMA